MVENWQVSYYMLPVWYACVLLALFIGIKKIKKEKSYLLFLVYIIVSLICLFIWEYIDTFMEKGRKKTLSIEIVNTLFSFTETWVFIYYFSRIIHLKFKKIFTALSISILCITFLVLFILMLAPGFTKKQIIDFGIQVNIIEFFSLLLLSLIFFYDMITRASVIKTPLFKTPSFLIITALFLYILVSLPFLLISNKLISFNKELYYLMFGIHYISISILFLCLGKAFTCKIPLTT